MKRATWKGGRRKSAAIRGRLFDGQRSWQHRKRLIALSIVGGFTLLVVMAAVFGEQGLLKVRRMARERKAMQEKVTALAMETQLLRGKVRNLGEDTFHYEKAARERFGLVKPGEVVYDFRSDPLTGNP